ncbi:mediator complex subunit MED10 [Besnoitia besnoiti]|uniref:Mediator of RNA polymerase II transcription subunit 10 n=1 Tax=Besnoitia besnoiti TaxID=94643 RepID=A0A2A9M8J3_BESBE|nr:mediator complex subunit MED10 [Besnoitia besnoiti]PFH34798.1 mediator complex subunit MED10 [Besnoitia besnoiti]
MSLQPSSSSSLPPASPLPSTGTTFPISAFPAESSSAAPTAVPAAAPGLPSLSTAPLSQREEVASSDEDHSSLSNSSSDGNDSEDEPGSKRAKTAENADVKSKRKNRDKGSLAGSERHRRKVAKLYLKTVHCLTKITLLLEDGNVVLPAGRTDNKTSRRLSKLLLRYDRMLVKLEEYMATSSHLANASVPVGLLKALDMNVDPMDWMKRCVVDVHREKNDQLRGVFQAFGAYEATLHDAMRYGPADRLLPPLPRLCPHSAGSAGPFQTPADGNTCAPDQ